jgi:putative flippase GtrA
MGGPVPGRTGFYVNSQEILFAVIAFVLAGRVAYLVYGRWQQRGRPGTSGGPSREGGSGPSRDVRFRMYMRLELVAAVLNEALLIILTSAGIYYIYSSAIAMEAASLAKFFGNDSLTFKDRRTGTKTSRLVKSNVLSLVGMAMNLAILYLGTTDLGLSYATSNLIGMAVAIPLSFVLHTNYAWKEAGA